MTERGRPRIAHIMAGALMGGAELFFERLCIAQRARQYPLHAFIRRGQARVARLQAGGVPLDTYRFGQKLDFLTRPRLRRDLRRFRPDIAVSWMNRATRATPKGPWTHAGRLGGYYNLEFYRNCDVLIGNTRGLRRWMINEGWPEKHVFYLPNFATDYADVAPQRPDFIPANKPFLFAMGRLHTNKGFDILIRALADIPRAHVVIAGEGEARHALKQLAAKVGVADRVHLPGWILDTGPWLRACDVFVCPSRIEPLGNIVIEALSAARPIVAGEIQGPGEILCGTEDGVLAESENPQDFSSKINTLLADPFRLRVLSENGRARYEQEFSPETVLTQWDAFFNTVRLT